MWIAIAGDDDIQLVPQDEQYYHLWNITCECCPVTSIAEDGMLIIRHNPFEDKEIFERASESKMHTVRQRLDC